MERPQGLPLCRNMWKIPEASTHFRSHTICAHTDAGGPRLYAKRTDRLLPQLKLVGRGWQGAQESGAITVMLPPVAMGPETIWRPGVVLHVRPPHVTPPRELLTPERRGDTMG